MEFFANKLGPMPVKDVSDEAATRTAEVRKKLAAQHGSAAAPQPEQRPAQAAAPPPRAAAPAPPPPAPAPEPKKKKGWF